jgi:hypothetical protein
MAAATSRKKKGASSAAGGQPPPDSRVVESFMAQMGGAQKRVDPLEAAQEIMWDAWDLTDAGSALRSPEKRWKSHRYAPTPM